MTSGHKMHIARWNPGPIRVVVALAAVSLAIYYLPWAHSDLGSRWVPPLPHSSQQSCLAEPRTQSQAPEPVFTEHDSGHLYLSTKHILSNNSESSSTHQAEVIEHPIYGLIRNATRRWNEKLDSQSKSLEEAVREYQRRYGKNPPKGFDQWFKFARDNGVILVDEYDSMQDNLLPFWGISPSLLRSRNSNAAERYTDSWTTKVVDGEASLSGKFATGYRAVEQKALMDRYVQFLPNMEYTVSIHDGPSQTVSWKAKSRLVEAAKKGEYLPDDLAEEVDDDPASWGFRLACPPTSRIHRAADGLEYTRIPQAPSFISDHPKAMDLCQNPEWQYLHGFTMHPGFRPFKHVPIFSMSRWSQSSDVGAVPLEQFHAYLENPPKWQEKKSDKLVWRGSTTGTWFYRDTPWRSSQRVRLHFLGNDVEGTAKVRFWEKSPVIDEDLGSSYGIEVNRTQLGRVYEVEVGRAELKERYTDIGFAGEVHQCPDETMREAVKKYVHTLPRLSEYEQAGYKYVMDVDGNAWSGRFHRLLGSNSVVFKSTIFPEWYIDRIQPWVHYVPVKIDYSDVFDLMAFFSGDMDRGNSNDDLAERISVNAREFVEKHWRYEDMEAYTFRLHLEWARLLAENRSSMDYEG